MVDLTKLNTLKNKMQLAVDFSTPWNYFFDHFGENPAFLQMGKPIENKMILGVAKSVGQQIFKKKNVRVDNSMLTKLPEYHFIHGACFVEMSLCIVFFFSDIDQGLMAIHVQGDETRLVRFTSTMLDNDDDMDYYVAPRDTNIN